MSGIENKKLCLLWVAETNKLILHGEPWLIQTNLPTTTLYNHISISFPQHFPCCVIGGDCHHVTMLQSINKKYLV